MSQINADKRRWLLICANLCNLRIKRGDYSLRELYNNVLLLREV